MIKLKRFYELEKELTLMIQPFNEIEVLEKYRNDKDFAEKYNSLRDEYNEIAKQEDFINAKKTTGKKQ